MSRLPPANWGYGRAIMNNPASTQVVVVGVSGSPASARALRWAADEAERRQGRLKVVLAWRPQRYASQAPSLVGEELAARQQRARDGLAATVRAVLGPDQAAAVSTDVSEGDPERALVDSSAGADLLVLGAASGQLAGRSIGPVVRTCLSRAHCPVVVVGPEGQGLGSEAHGYFAHPAHGSPDDVKLGAGVVPAPRPGD
jgi:nucleotide-binding universal stress UspA family protein